MCCVELAAPLGSISSASQPENLRIFSCQCFRQSWKAVACTIHALLEGIGLHTPCIAGKPWLPLMGAAVACRLVNLAAGGVAGKFLRFEDGVPEVAAQTAYGIEAEVGQGAVHKTRPSWLHAGPVPEFARMASMTSF